MIPMENFERTEIAAPEKRKRSTAITIALVILIAWGLFSTVMYVSLEFDYDSIESSKKSLESAYDLLGQNYDTIESNRDEILAAYDGLLSNYNSLVSNWNDKIELEKMRVGYGNYSQGFITPDDPDVRNATRQMLGHIGDGDLSWSDMDKINNWVHANIGYNNDTSYGPPGSMKAGGECWLFPNETLALKRGDCEDMTLLMASICNAEESVDWVWAAEIKLTGTDGSESGHLCIFIDVGDDKMNIYDPTWGWSSGSSKSEQSAISQYVNGNGFASLEVERIFNTRDVRSFDSNQEFFDNF